MRIQLQKCESVRRNLAEFWNAGRMVFLLDSKGAKVCKSCRSHQELSNEYLVITWKHWRRYSRERASQSLPEISQKLEKMKKYEKHIGYPCFKWLHLATGPRTSHAHS